MKIQVSCIQLVMDNSSDCDNYPFGSGSMSYRPLVQFTDVWGTRCSNKTKLRSWSEGPMITDFLFDNTAVQYLALTAELTW